jgi:hypothetical protein
MVVQGTGGRLGAMSRNQRAGWALIAVAGAISTSIVAFEIVQLVTTADPESSETLPVIGFEPIVGD